jgi:hypothetical protein
MVKSKYGSKKVTRDGETFDSLKEYRRFCELRLLERAGAIQNLQRQVKFVLIPAQYEFLGYTKTGKEKKKCIERECAYIADFVYDENCKIVVEDVKGYKQSTAYQLFSIKRKLMLKVYGIRIREV